MTGPTGGATLLVRTATSGLFDRPQAGALITLSAECDPGSVPIGGGVTNLVAHPQDEGRTHLLDSGPTASGWHSNATVVSTFSQGGTLEVVVSVVCMVAP